MAPDRYLDLDLPPLFALETDRAGVEWGAFTADLFARGDDGSYVCAGHGGAPIYLRAVARDGLRFTHVDGDGRRQDYRLRIIDPGEVTDGGPSWVALAEANLRAGGLVGWIARSQRALLESAQVEPLSTPTAEQRWISGPATYAVYVDETGWEDLLRGAAIARSVVFSPGPAGGSAAGRFAKPDREPPAISYEDAFPPDGGAERESRARPLSNRSREPMYLGRSRNLRAELALLLTDGTTARSSLRRTFAALVGWRYGWNWQASEHRPDGSPTKAGVMRFTLDPGYESHLTRWMLRHLRVGWSTRDDVRDPAGADKLLRYFCPPLRGSASGADPLGRATRDALGTVRSIVGWTGWGA